MTSHNIAVSADLVSRIPELRAFAISLCRSADQSDDLVQDTLLSAWANLDHFKEGTNLGAWLTTILRNRFVNLYRRQRVRGEVVGTSLIETAAVIPAQDGWEIASDLGDALDQLPRHQRQAVMMVGADGLSLAEAAVACKCEVGTIKSRVSRARAHLSTLLGDNAGATPRTHRRRSPREERLTPRAPAARRRPRDIGRSHPLHVAAAAQN
jgi:RNA polymerase sigma-70 factor (ECF subfamily)